MIASICQAPVDNLNSRVTLIRRIQATTHKFTSRSNICPELLQSASFCLGLVPLLVMSVGSLQSREKEVLVWVELLPMTSHSHSQTDTYADKCKISVMMYMRKGVVLCSQNTLVGEICTCYPCQLQAGSEVHP